MAVTGRSTPFPLQYSLQTEGPYETTNDSFAVGIRVLGNGRVLHRFGIVLSGEKQYNLVIRHERLGVGVDETYDALFRWGVRRVEMLLEDGQSAWDEVVTSTSLVVQDGDLAELAGAWGSKSCDFQIQERRRLLCSAATADDPSVIASEGVLKLAPTSDALCRGCEMPDSNYLCSHLINPEVTSVGSDQQGIVARRLTDAMCQLGRPEIGQPGGCRAGRHACWERLVDVGDTAIPPVAPLAVVSAIDYLDASWRGAAVSGHQHLFRHRVAEHIADLAQPCATRSEFRDRVSELDDVLKSIQAPKDDASFSAEVRGAGPLVRLKHFLAARIEALPEGAGPAADVRNAIDRLLTVNKLRVAFQHGQTSDVDLYTLLATFGVGYPVGDWTLAWRRVEAHVVTSLTRVARTVSDLL